MAFAWNWWPASLRWWNPWPPPSTKTAACSWPNSTAIRASRGRVRRARAGSGCWRTGTATAPSKRRRCMPTSWSGPPAWRSGKGGSSSRRRRTSSISRTRTATAGPMSASRFTPGSASPTSSRWSTTSCGAWTTRSTPPPAATEATSAPAASRTRSRFPSTTGTSGSVR